MLQPRPARLQRRIRPLLCFKWKMEEIQTRMAGGVQLGGRPHRDALLATCHRKKGVFWTRIKLLTRRWPGKSHTQLCSTGTPHTPLGHGKMTVQGPVVVSFNRDFVISMTIMALKIKYRINSQTHYLAWQKSMARRDRKPETTKTGGMAREQIKRHRGERMGV